MSTRLKTGLATAATAALLTLSACAGSGTDDARPAEGMKQADTGGSASLGEAPVPSAAEGYRSDLLSDSVDQATDSKADDSQAGAPTVAVVATGQVTLEGSDVAKARRAVQQVIDTYLGTISEEEESTNADGVAESIRVVIRVPSKNFAKAMQDLEAVATLRSSASNAEDVTTKVIDNEVRLRAQEKSLERIEALLASAKSLNEVIAIESQLSRRQADYDSLKSTQTWLKDQTTLSTITLNLQLAEHESKEKEGTGFLGGLDRGWDGLVAALVGLGTLLGLVLPFVGLGVLIGAPLWLALRGVRRRRQAAASDQD